MLEEHKLTERIVAAINTLLAVKGRILKEGTVVDATIIAAPSSTKNQSGERDAEMHQTKKGNPWHFGMKTHIGADAESGITHTLVTTPANTNDVTQPHAFLHGEEIVVFGDAGDQGVGKGTRTWTLLLNGKWRCVRASAKALSKTAIGKLKEQIERIRPAVPP